MNNKTAVLILLVGGRIMLTEVDVEFVMSQTYSIHWHIYNV